MQAPKNLLETLTEKLSVGYKPVDFIIQRFLSMSLLFIIISLTVFGLYEVMYEWSVLLDMFNDDISDIVMDYQKQAEVPVTDIESGSDVPQVD